MTAGELLVSAYTDFGFKTQVTAARAEIYAETIRRATCVLPQHRSVKEAKTARRSAVSLLVGRRRIALFGGGIPEKPCEKETKTYWLTLPGGFSLPLGIAQEFMSMIQEMKFCRKQACSRVCSGRSRPGRSAI